MCLVKVEEAKKVSPKVLSDDLLPALMRLAEKIEGGGRGGAPPARLVMRERRPGGEGREQLELMATNSRALLPVKLRVCHARPFTLLLYCDATTLCGSYYNGDHVYLHTSIIFMSLAPLP